MLWKMRVWRLVGGDAVEPSSQRPLALERSNTAQNLDARFLQDVLGVIMTHYNAADVPVERLPVLLHERPESLVSERGVSEHLLQCAVIGLDSHTL